MNYIKSAIFGLLIFIPTAYSNTAAAGSIILAKEDGSTCAMPLPELPNTYVRYNLRRSSSPCYYFNDNVVNISFLDVPSATEVILTNYEGYPHNDDQQGVCSKGNYSFIVTLTTTKKQTTTPFFGLDELAPYTPGMIIRPGLQMKSIDSTKQLRDALSCVSIKISDAPPATP